MTDGLGCIRVFGADRSGAPHGVRAYPHFLPTVWAHFPVTAGECALFSMHTHRKKKKCAISSPPAGQLEIMHENFMHWHLCMFAVRCSCMQFYAQKYTPFFRFFRRTGCTFKSGMRSVRAGIHDLVGGLDGAAQEDCAQGEGHDLCDGEGPPHQLQPSSPGQQPRHRQ